MLSNPAITDTESDLPVIARELSNRFGDVFTFQPTADLIPTLWIDKENLRSILVFLKHETRPGYALLFDLTAMDERVRVHREGLPESAFTVIYHLLSFGRNQDIRI
ncbi:MAG: NADH-quinone oxidoreductase subunit C, partial [Methylosarcina sp.]